MARRFVHGVVSVEEWKRIGREDDVRRAGLKERDTASSLLTALAALVTLAMLTVGPMWTLIAVVGDTSGRGAAFDALWAVPFVLTFVAAAPLALALRREVSRARLALAGLLVVSLVIELATCPYF